MNGTPLYHQPNHVARSTSFAAANSNLSLPIICAYNDLKKRQALQQITRDCRLWRIAGGENLPTEYLVLH